MPSNLLHQLHERVFATLQDDLYISSTPLVPTTDKMFEYG